MTYDNSEPQPRMRQYQPPLTALDTNDLNTAADHLAKVRRDTADHQLRMTAIYKAIDAAAHISGAGAKDIVTLTTFFYHFMSNTVPVPTARPEAAEREDA